MFEALTGLDWLAEQFQSTIQRVAVTGVAVFVMLVVLFASQRLLRWLHARTRPLYADLVTAVALIATFVCSAAVTIGVWGQGARVQNLSTEYDIGGDFVARVVLSFALFVVTYVVARVVHRFLKEVLSSASAVTPHQREITYRLTQVVIWGVALIVVLGIWVDDLGGLLVGAGFLGIVLGMAARQTLGAMLAGFVLMFDRPFEIGDWVEIDGEEGIVTDISIANTRIQNFDGEYVMVPNDLVGASMVTNRSKRGRLRVEVDVGVDFDTDLERASELAREAVTDLEESLEAPRPQVVGKSFGDSAIVLGVRIWIDNPSARRRWKARTAMIGAIKAAFDAEGIKIPYPQRELSGRDEDGGLRVADGDGSGGERGEPPAGAESEGPTTPRPEDE